MNIGERIKRSLYATVGAVVLLALASIVFAIHRKHQFDLRTTKYVLGMRTLRDESTLRHEDAFQHIENLKMAEKLFTEIATEGDVRGDFGLACVLYIHNGGRDGSSDLAKSKMEYAAVHGLVTAQAALLSYYASGYSTPVNLDAANRLLFRVLDAARNSAFMNPIDPALPVISATHPMARNSPEFVWEILKHGLCAPALSDEDIQSVMKKEPKPLFNFPVVRTLDP